MKNHGFTLLELLIVIGIIAVVASVSVLVINPGEYFRRGRDVQRIADLNNLHLALTLYYTSGVSNFDLDGPNYSNSCSDQASPKVFISTPSGVAGPANLPSGWSYVSSTSANLRKTDGNGWIPVNLASIPAGSPLNNLPIDPTNDVNYALHYTYACQSSPGHYELNANLESRQFNKNGKDDRTSKDGGDDPNVYETGSRLTINPMAPVGYWAFDEGAGTTAGDSSKNGNNGTFGASPRTPIWNTQGKLGQAINFDASVPANGDIINFSDSPTFQFTTGITLSAWIYPGTATGQSEWIIARAIGVSPWDDYKLVRSGTSVYSVVRLAAGVLEVSSGAGAINPGGWYYIIGTYDASSGKAYLYINGVQKGPSSGVGNIQVLSTKFKIGCWSTGVDACDQTTPYNGIIDEPQIYNRALSAAEALHYYNATR